MVQKKVDATQVDITVGLPSVNVLLGDAPTPFVSWYFDATVSPQQGVAIPPATGIPSLDGIWNGPGPGSYLTDVGFGFVYNGPTYQQGFAIETLGAITPGSLYTAGVYPGVSLTGGAGGGATANITVAGGIVTSVVLVDGGFDYKVGDVLSALAVDIGGTGSGFSIPVFTLVPRDFVVWGLNTLEIELNVLPASAISYLQPSISLRDIDDDGYTFGIVWNSNIDPSNIVRMFVQRWIGGQGTEVRTTASFDHGGNLTKVKLVDNGTDLVFYLNDVVFETQTGNTLLPPDFDMNRLERIRMSSNTGERWYTAHILGT
jgi:hypothetical protein